MGDILPFVARVRDSGDWTAAERARLEALADQFTKAGVHVEVIYGATDDGDPWCVVKDANEEVLVHVARIDGRFVVHFAAQDTFEEGADLPSALGVHLAELHVDPEHQDEVVVPFSLVGRQAQGLLALIVATAFFYDTRPAEAAPPSDQAAPAAPAEHDASALAASSLDTPDKPERDATSHAVVMADPAPGPAIAHAVGAEQAAPAAPFRAPEVVEEAQPAPAPAETKPDPAPPLATSHAAVTVDDAPHTLSGGAGNDVLVGSSGADLIVGGAGADTLQGGGAAPGQFDTLVGGAGDDRIELGPQVVAVGGEGADTFVFHAPAHMGVAATLLGVVLDFHATEGDRFVNARGEHVTMTERPGLAPPPEGFNFTALRPNGPPGQPGTPQEITWTRLDVDLDHDGRPDGYVLLANGHGGVVLNMTFNDPNHDPSDQVLVAVGRDLSYSEIG